MKIDAGIPIGTVCFVIVFIGWWVMFGGGCNTPYESESSAIRRQADALERIAEEMQRQTEQQVAVFGNDPATGRMIVILHGTVYEMSRNELTNELGIE